MDKPTSFDIAQLAGVSQPTVSRALRGSPSVSEATRKRIQAIAQQLNYKVDKNATNLRSGTTGTLALLLFEDPSPDDSRVNPFFLAMIAAVTRETARRGYDLIVSFQQLSTDWHLDYDDTRRADGLILLGYGDYTEAAPRLERLHAQGTRFVRWGAPSPAARETVVGCDNMAGARAATEHLLSLGRRRVAFLGDVGASAPEFAARHAGYAAALRAAGLPADPALTVPAASTAAAGEAAAQALLALSRPPDAAVAASDLIALGAMRAFQRAGRGVPRDIAVTGFDDMLAAALANPPLTTVTQEPAQAGAALVDALISLTRGEEPDNRTIAPRLIVRASCGA